MKFTEKSHPIMQVLGIVRLTGNKVGPRPSGFEVLGYHHALWTGSRCEGEGPGILARSSFFRSRKRVPLSSPVAFGTG